MPATLAVIVVSPEAQALNNRLPSPLGHKHVNMLGRYTFTLPDTVAKGELRPLRDPHTAEVDEA